MRPASSTAYHVRVARPVTDLGRSVRLYCDGLGLSLLDAFEDHDGFDGAMIGAGGAGYHIELTRARTRPLVPAPTAEDLLVFYVPSLPQWHDACERMRRAGFSIARPHNPYWETCASTFVDHDGYRVVLHRGAWTRSLADHH